MNMLEIMDLRIFLVLWIYLVLWIFLEDDLEFFLLWIFLVQCIFLMKLLNRLFFLLYLFLAKTLYLFIILLINLSVQYRVREVGHHPLKRQPLPKLGFQHRQVQFRQATRSGTT